MVFTNKHVVTAMLVAPLLAVVAWFGAGQFAGETPEAAIPGQAYPLVEQSNCRYASGVCDIENETFRLRLTAAVAGGSELLLTSSHPLDGVVLGVGLPQEETQPDTMRAEGGQRLEWRVKLAAAPGPGQRVRLVAMALGSSYFADVDTAFLQSQDN